MSRLVGYFPLAELGAPPPGAVFASTYKEAVNLIKAVYDGELQVLDTSDPDTVLVARQEPLGEGILENIQDNPDTD